MNLLKHEAQLKQLAHEWQAQNTLNGGLVAPRVHVEKTPQQIRIHIKVASLPASAYNIVKYHNRMEVFTVVPGTMPPEDQAFTSTSSQVTPAFFKTIPLGAEVNTQAIEAVYRNKELLITLPLKDQSELDGPEIVPIQVTE